MSIERVNPAALARPSGFSHAVVGHGTLVLLAGQTALDAAGRITGADVVAQFEVALGNLLTALAAAGGRPDQLTSLTVYVVDLDDYRATRPRSARCGGGWSAGTTRPWRRSAWPGCGTPRPWSRCRAWRSSECADVLTIVIPAPYVTL